MERSSKKKFSINKVFIFDFTVNNKVRKKNLWLLKLEEKSVACLTMKSTNVLSVHDSRTLVSQNVQAHANKQYVPLVE